MGGDLITVLRTAQSGLVAQQQALDTVAQNVANVNTEGYSRKTVQLERRVIAGVGAGVETGTVTRTVDTGLLRTLRTEDGALSALDVQTDVYDRIMDVFGTLESDTSLAHELSDFQTAIESLALSPQNALEIKELVRQGETLSSTLQNISNEIDTLREDMDQRIGELVTEANNYIQQVVDYNEQISSLNAIGQSTADLEDLRDNALDALSKLIDITVVNHSGGEVQVFAGNGRTLVGTTATQISHSVVSTVTPTTIYAAGGFDGIYLGDAVEANDITGSVASGELAGLLALRDTILPDLQASVDALAAEVRDTVNEAHNRGTPYPGLQQITSSRTFVDPTQETLGFTSGDTAIVLFDAEGEELASTTARTLLGGASGLVSDFTTALDGWLSSVVPGASASVATGQLVIDIPGSDAFIAFRDEVDPPTDHTRADASLTLDVVPAGGIDETGSGFSSFLGLNDFFTGGISRSLYDSDILSTATTPTTAATLTFATSAGVLDTVALTTSDDLAAVAAKIDAVSGLHADLIPEGTGYRLRVGTDDGVDVNITDGGAGYLTAIGMEPSSTGTAETLSVRSAVKEAPDLISRGTPQWDESRGVSGAYIMGVGDDTVIQEIAEAFDADRSFDEAGSLSSMSGNLVFFAETLIADQALAADSAQSQYDVQDSLVSSLREKSDTVRGVNLDQEFSELILYEKAYAASARVVSVVQSLFDTLDQAIR